LSNKLREVLGREAGEDLMTWLEEERAQRERVWSAVEGLEKSVTALGEEMRLGFARVDARFDLVFGRMNVALEKQNTAIERQNSTFATAIEKQNTAIEKQNSALERGLKEQTRFYFLAWAVLLAAILGLYAR
jgi:hypothetical protein